MFGTARTLGKYRLIAEIARGGMGIVYLAMVQGPGGFNKLVVVKELKPELVEEPAFLTMFLDEARLAARLNHPNIVTTNEVGNDGERYFMAMDYLDGRGLDRVRRRARNAGQGLSVPMHLRVLCDMLAGLHYAHTLTDFDGSPLHVVHRDVSPQNVFVTFDGQIKLLDFGIAKARDSMQETQAGVLKGKMAYMAPEQARGEKVDVRADIFSAGVVMWESLAGRKLREGQSEQQSLMALVDRDLPRISSIKPWIPEALDTICARAMAWEREDRYPTALAFQEALEGYLSSTGTNITAREVGQCVSTLFRDDRAETNALIERYVTHARTAPAEDDDLPVIDVSMSPLSLNTPISSSFDVPSFDLASGNSPSPTSASSNASGSLLAPPPPPVPDPAPARPARRVAVVAGAAVGVIAIAGVLFATRSHDKPAPAAPAASLVSPGAAPAPAPAAMSPSVEPPATAMVDIDIRATPVTATIVIDGAPVDGNAFRKRVVSDGRPHQLIVSAPGFISRAEQVTFDANVRLELSLQPAPKAGVAVTRARPVVRPLPRATETAVRVETPAKVDPPVRVEAAPAEPPPPKKVVPADIDPAGGAKPRRTIDSNNPYGGS